VEARSQSRAKKSRVKGDSQRAPHCKPSIYGQAYCLPARRSCKCLGNLQCDYALGHIPTRHYLANETYFHLLVLAYDLMNWFQRLCLPPEFQSATLQTLRHKVLLMPAQLRRTHNRRSLALPASAAGELAWRFAFNKINKLKP
jgi:Transposase DDE domain group 1